MVDEGGDRRTLVLRAAAAALCSLGAVAIGLWLQLRLLDVALYAVLAPITALTLLVGLPRAGGAVRMGARRPPAPSVVPEPDGATGEAAATQAAELTVTHARDQVVAGAAAGGDLEELLAMSARLHEAALDLARATLASGGDVPQALRDEIALQDRGDRVGTSRRVEPRTPAV
jgi:hypothetical protein